MRDSTRFQCLCWEVYTFLLFNKFYSLTTMSVCVLVKFILWFHEQELRFSFHSLGLIMNIFIFSSWAYTRIKLFLFTWILTQPCNSLWPMKTWTVVSCITTKKEALRDSTFILHFLWLQHNLKCLRWLLYYPKCFLTYHDPFAYQKVSCLSLKYMSTPKAPKWSFSNSA